jgi:uncharacterized protein
MHTIELQEQQYVLTILNMINVTAIKAHILSVLKEGLSSKLTYHNINHTLDVTSQCMQIAGAEGITDKEVLSALYIAALYHDAGFLFVYTGHEEKSCELARKELPGYGVDPDMIENICTIIMATKIPQSPKNLLQQIICDADLDYLGRDDFFTISENLCKEMLEYKIVNSKQEWEDRQILFLQTHSYFTPSEQRKRTPAIVKNVEKLLTGKREEEPKP